MDILITTGFEKISHAIRFQPETEPKGKKLVDANHVFNVKEHRKEGQSFLIEACVLRQASVSSAAYITKLCIDAVRTVRSVSCTCVYNRSERCKHVAALIYYINNEQSLTKTDKEQEWGKPTARQLAKSKYSKGKNFFEMYPPQPKLQIKATPIEVNMSELNEPSGLRMTLLEGMKRKTDRTIPNLMDSMLNEVEIMQQREDCEICVNTFFILNEKQATYTTDPILSVKLEEFYNKFIVKTKNEVMKLCCDTLEQSKCQSWFEARKLRISASSNAHCIKRRIRKPVESVVAEMLNPIFFETAATKYGRDNESVAAVQYQKVYGTCVKKVGLISEKIM